MPQWQKWTVATETVWPTKTIWPFTKNICWLLLKNMVKLTLQALILPPSLITAPIPTSVASVLQPQAQWLEVNVLGLEEPWSQAYPLWAISHHGQTRHITYPSHSWPQLSHVTADSDPAVSLPCIRNVQQNSTSLPHLEIEHLKTLKICQSYIFIPYKNKYYQHNLTIKMF